MDYRTVFDSAEATYQWWWPALGLIPVAAGLVFCRAAFRRGVEASWRWRAFAVFFLGFGLLWAALALFGTLSQFNWARSACSQGKCRVAEGRVEEFRALPSPGPNQKGESFVVD